MIWRAPVMEEFLDDGDNTPEAGANGRGGRERTA
jgi:hypothetical protein